jgi:hypothetical protein
MHYLGETSRRINEHANIMHRVDNDTVSSSCQCHHMCVTVMKCTQWENLRRKKFIPAQAKSVEHEARNGILLCKSLFDAFYFYIRWVRQVRLPPSIIPLRPLSFYCFSFIAHTSALCRPGASC